MVITFVIPTCLSADRFVIRQRGIPLKHIKMTSIGKYKRFLADARNDKR